MKALKLTGGCQNTRRERSTKIEISIERCSRALDEVNVPVRTLLVSEGHKSRDKIPGTLAL